ncbi:MAG: DUF2628 domain-containing protein [Rhizobiaceae bacterium]
MASFIVMSDKVISDKGDKPEDNIRFVRDEFSIVAFAVPLVWLLWHRLWLHAALCFAAFGVCAALVTWNGNPAWLGFSAIASASISLFVAHEGGEWLRQTLAQNGYRELDVIPARNSREAEEIFASRLIETVVRKPSQGFAPVSSASLIPLTGNL